jgi:MFS family permease
VRGRGNREIVRLQAVWAAAALAKWAFTILVAIVAYGEGGVAGVGIAALARAAPPAVLAPWIALLVDRSSRVAALRVSCAVRASGMAATSIAVATGAPLPVVLAAVVVVTVADTAHRPAQAALLPGLARTPAELARANTAWSVLDSAGFLVGSLLVGVLVAGAGLEPACWVCTALFTTALAGTYTLRTDPPRPVTAATGGTHVLGGLRVLRRDRRLRLLVGSYGVDMLAQGVLDVLLVVAAIELLGLGEEGAGWLSAAWGAGALLSGVAAGVLLRRGRAATALLLGFASAGAALVVVGSVPVPAVALALLAVFGVGSGLIEIAHLNLTQRLVPPAVLGRVYGVQEVIDVATTALGGIAATGLVALLGVPGALVAVGAVLPVVALVLCRPLRALEPGERVPEREFALLRGLEVLAPLPVASIEALALRARVEHLDAGAVLVAPGHALLVVADGVLDVVVDGVWRRIQAVGELAGLPTATVRARTPVTLLAVDRTDVGPGRRALSRR